MEFIGGSGCPPGVAGCAVTLGGLEVQDVCRGVQDVVSHGWLEVQDVCLEVEDVVSHGVPGGSGCGVRG